MQTTWQLSRLASTEENPNESDWIPASVPGAVQLDWARRRRTINPSLKS